MNKRHISYYLAGSISLITLAVYLPALRNGFVNWDDNAYVYDNIRIRSLDLSFFRWALTDIKIAYWQPVALISHALDYAVWGLNPLGHHLTSILFHAVNTSLVVLLIIKLLGTAGNINTVRAFEKAPLSGRNNIPCPLTFLNDRGLLIAGGVTGLLFGLHPLHVESVAWVTERKDVLYALFYLLGILSYIRYVSTSSPDAGNVAMQNGCQEMSPPEAAQKVTQAAVTEHGVSLWNKHYLMTVLLFILAIASKAMAVTFPAVLLVLDWYPFKRIRTYKQLEAALKEKIPFILISLIVAVITFVAQESAGSVVSYEEIPIGYRVPVAFWSLMMYLRNMIFPLDLLPFYPYPDTVSYLSFKYSLAILLVAGITSVCIYLRRRQPFWLAAWSYYVISLFPVLGLVQVSDCTMADRFTYLPSLGPFLVIGLAAAWICEKADLLKKWGVAVKRTSVIVALFLCIAMGYATVKQIAVWRSSTDLWNYVIGKISCDAPMPAAMAVPHNNLGMEYLSQYRLDEALTEFNIALKLKPQFAAPHNNIGLIYADWNRIDDATNEYKAALGILPDYPIARNNLGNAYLLQNRIDDAINEYKTALQLQPGNTEAHYNLGNVYLNHGLLDDAMGEFRTAIVLNPYEPDVHNSLGTLFARQGRFDEALREFSVALDLNPNSVAARRNLENCYSRIRTSGEQSELQQ